MFRGRDHLPTLLHSSNILDRKFPAQHRVLRERFEVPAAERIAHATDRGREQDICGLGEGFRAENATQLPDATLGPSRCLQDWRW
jgi:hypothetical protein